MFNESCIFCKIIQGHIKSNFIKENEFVVALYDIAPKAPTHILLIPKKHIVSFADIQDDDSQYMWHLCKMARDLSLEMCNGNDFNLVSNNGAAAGQSVFHLHLHFLSGKNIFDSGIKL